MHVYVRSDSAEIPSDIPEVFVKNGPIIIQLGRHFKVRLGKTQAEIKFNLFSASANH